MSVIGQRKVSDNIEHSQTRGHWIFYRFLIFVLAFSAAFSHLRPRSYIKME